MPQNILNRILESKRKEVERLYRSPGLEAFKAAAGEAPRARNFFSAVTRKSSRPVNLIAEIKRASPSAGIIREDFDVPNIARAYARAGANALSVLTDEDFFRGCEQFLRSAREAVELPVLRKDFIIDPIQVYQSRALGADAILLIAAAMPVGELLDLMILATELRMTALVEVHGGDEMMQIRSMVGFPHARYGLIGINNRDLATFEVDLKTTLRLAPLAEGRAPIVSESGIRTHEDVLKLGRAGVSAILVGEAFMRSDDVESAVRKLMEPPRSE